MGYANLSDTTRLQTMQVVMDKWVGEEKDLILVSLEGYAVYTHRLVHISSVSLIS